jgi:Raf kinase inhibitor-like YbhB/YbcL family protein
MKNLRLLLAVALVTTMVATVVIAQAPPAGGGQAPAAGGRGGGPGGPGGGAPGGGGQGRGGGGRGGGGISAWLTITVDGYEDGAMMPSKYAGNTAVSPKISWTGAPPTTQAFAIIFHDMEVALQAGTDDVLHWMLWDIPGTATGLPENVPAGDLPDGTRQGRGIRGTNQYFGPGTPAGRTHHYVFEVYALNAKLGLPPTATRAEVMAALAGKVVGKGVYVGRYRQPGQ